ncbi:MAG: hypothetical protein ACPGWR_14985 [Ardenticatenaceae bacterium]
MFNTKVRLLLIAFMLFSAILPFPAPAWGCSCAEPGSPEEAFMRAEAVFVGTALGGGDAFWNPLYARFVGVYHQFVPPLPPIIMDAGSHRTATSFEVAHSWRGAKTTHFTVRTGLGDRDCGYRFQQGKQYLVYVYEWAHGSLYAGSCSRTAPLASATQDLNYLQTVPKLELTYVPPMLNPLMLCLVIPLLGVIGLAVLIWRRHRIKRGLQHDTKC